MPKRLLRSDREWWWSSQKRLNSALADKLADFTNPKLKLFRARLNSALADKLADNVDLQTLEFVET